MNYNFLRGPSFDLIHDFDPEVSDLLLAEEKRQMETIDLIASENYASPLACGLEGSVFADKNAEGHASGRFVAGCEYVNQLENLAADRLKKLFGCEHANVQAMSATIGNIAVLRACLKPGDTILSMELNQGGHLSHGASFHDSGKTYRAVFYHVDPKTERIDMVEVERLAREHKPQMIICGTSSYPRLIDYEEFSRIAKEAGAFLFADIAHNVGLIAAGAIPSPVPYADVVTSSTHKTWRGSRGGGVVLCKKALAQKIDRAIFPGLQGAPKMDMIAARAVQFKESGTPEFKRYARQVLNNAKALAEALNDGGIRLVSGGTDTHLILADVRGLNLTGMEAEALLESVGIIVNKNMIPYDPLPAKDSSGLRLGSPAMTTRGMNESDMKAIGGLVIRTLHAGGEAGVREREAIKKEVLQIVQNYPLFDERWLPHC